ncbi:cytochrome c oxidase accessory protein CcoG [Salinibius halmophilus]|uniref:cytochrome c oxidase accessory protein CcoG n=1 Tax=Salinibius halmophilus TaxID=1853216 RepID=UPI000E668AF0|nr:cytochrome c oxidase accessory protein CcoG [Salinibius halmophilus]
MSDDRIAAVQVDPQSTDLYASREKIYVRRVKGLYRALRLYGGAFLFALYFGVVWLQWNGRQAVWFDLPSREFHIFGLTLWPQDFTLLTFALIICAFGLFFITVFAGRVWCGYACPQSVWTWIYMFIEEKTEGPRNVRIRQDKQKLTQKLLAQRTAKHVLWLIVALATAITFVGYFAPIRELIPNLFTLQISGWAAFWLFFFTAATYINAGWMREQVCIYMCPYARFQSVMFDADTLVVSYDKNRGEPRGSRKRGVEVSDKGDCIDCQICVQVCPTGIDIRNGLQYECITCAACIDACDDVMNKMGYEPGLIRYTTENALNGKPTKILRPRLFGYGALMVLMIGILAAWISLRVPLDIDVMRERDQLSRVLSDGRIENVYTLQLLNMTERPQTVNLLIESDIEISFIGPTTLTLDGSANQTLPVRLVAEGDDITLPVHDVDFIMSLADDPDTSVKQESRFIGRSNL